MFYIYEIKNLLNDKIYIGQRKCPANKIPETDSYMGSGKILHQAYEKYGKKNFTKTILAVAGTKEVIDVLEKVFIQLYREQGKAEYNITGGGSGGSFKGINKGRKVSEETKRKLREANVGKHLSEETKRKIQEKLLKNPNRKGVEISSETRERMRQSHLGKKRSKESIENQRKAQMGRVVSAETREKIRISNLRTKHKIHLEELK